jgi:flavin-dependent dehydrogenase
MASVVGTGRTIAELTHALNQVVRAELGSMRSISPCFHVIPLAPRQWVCNRRILAAGDAAGFVSPFSGEGITYALTSSILAAQAIGAASQSGRADEVRGYDAACKSEIVDKMRATETFGLLLLRYLDRADPMAMESALEDIKLVSYCTSYARGELTAPALVAMMMTRVPTVLARRGGFKRA